MHSAAAIATVTDVLNHPLLVYQLHRLVHKLLGFVKSCLEHQRVPCIAKCVKQAFTGLGLSVLSTDASVLLPAYNNVYGQICCGLDVMINSCAVSADAELDVWVCTPNLQ